MNRTKSIVSLSLATAAILCFIAGQPRFAILPSRIADFAGIALIMISGIVWAMPLGRNATVPAKAPERD